MVQSLSNKRTANITANIAACRSPRVITLIAERARVAVNHNRNWHYTPVIIADDCSRYVNTDYLPQRLGVSIGVPSGVINGDGVNWLSIGVTLLCLPNCISYHSVNDA